MGNHIRCDAEQYGHGHCRYCQSLAELWPRYLRSLEYPSFEEWVDPGRPVEFQDRTLDQRDARRRPVN